MLFSLCSKEVVACPPRAPGEGQIPPKDVFLLVSWPVYSFARICIHPAPAEAEATAIKMLMVLAAEHQLLMLTFNICT